jgi:hypothetical protein
LSARSGGPLEEGDEDSVVIEDAEFASAVLGVFKRRIGMDDALARTVRVQFVHVLRGHPARGPIDQVLLITPGEVEEDLIPLQDCEPSVLIRAREADLSGMESDGGRHIEGKEDRDRRN